MSSMVFVAFEQDDLTHELKDLYIPFNYKFLLISKINSSSEILDVYQIGKNGSKIFTHFSFWDEK